MQLQIILIVLFSFNFACCQLNVNFGDWNVIGLFTPSPTPSPIPFIAPPPTFSIGTINPPVLINPVSCGKQGCPVCSTCDRLTSTCVSACADSVCEKTVVSSVTNVKRTVCDLDCGEIVHSIQLASDLNSNSLPEMKCNKFRAGLHNRACFTRTAIWGEGDNLHTSQPGDCRYVPSERGEVYDNFETCSKLAIKSNVEIWAQCDSVCFQDKMCGDPGSLLKSPASVCSDAQTNDGCLAVGKFEGIVLGVTAKGNCRVAELLPGPGKEPNGPQGICSLQTGGCVSNENGQRPALETLASIAEGALASGFAREQIIDQCDSECLDLKKCQRGRPLSRADSVCVDSWSPRCEPDWSLREAECADRAVSWAEPVLSEEWSEVPEHLRPAACLTFSSSLRTAASDPPLQTGGFCSTSGQCDDQSALSESSPRLRWARACSRTNEVNGGTQQRLQCVHKACARPDACLPGGLMRGAELKDVCVTGNQSTEQCLATNCMGCNDRGACVSICPSGWMCNGEGTCTDPDNGAGGGSAATPVHEHGSSTQLASETQSGPGDLLDQQEQDTGGSTDWAVIGPVVGVAGGSLAIVTLVVLGLVFTRRTKRRSGVPVAASSRRRRQSSAGGHMMSSSNGEDGGKSVRRQRSRRRNSLVLSSRPSNENEHNIYDVPPAHKPKNGGNTGSSPNNYDLVAAVEDVYDDPPPKRPATATVPGGEYGPAPSTLTMVRNAAAVSGGEYGPAPSTQTMVRMAGGGNVPGGIYGAAPDRNSTTVDGDQYGHLSLKPVYDRVQNMVDYDQIKDPL